MRIIDRDALLETIKDKRHMVKTIDGTKTRGMLTPAIIRTILEQPEIEQPTVNQWIPVSERLPEEKEPVLATLYSGDIEIVFLYSGYFIDITEVYKYELEDVIAWQPLPEPYQESEADNE